MNARAHKRIRQIHLGLSLVLGVLLVLIAVSGSLLVFRDEIQRRMPAINQWDGQADIGFQRAQQLAREARPDYRLQILWFPTEARPYYQAGYFKEGEGYTGYRYWDPATGEPVEPPGQNLFDWLTTFHTSLYLGSFGVELVRWSTLLFTLLLATGLLLWWPGRDVRRWFRIRKNGRAFTRDLHSVVGALALPVLLVMTVTGVVLGFPASASRAVYWITGSEKETRADGRQPYEVPSQVPAMPQERAASESLLAKARAIAPEDAFFFYITYPVAPDENRQVRMQRGYEPYPFGLVYRYYFDQYSGELLAQELPDATPADRFLNHWNSRLHFGTFAGWPGLLLWFFVPLAVPLLAWTGVCLWLRRRKRRQRQRAGRCPGRAPRRP
ncbi:MAG: PepSY-associated TM helix domain-containing protein [Opitutales bacterium]